MNNINPAERSPRRRSVYAVLAGIVVVIGLTTRRYPEWFPSLIATYAGDVLWAMVAFLMFGILFPRMSGWQVALLAGLFSLAIELSHFYAAPWLDTIRDNRFGRLLFGYEFSWSDLVCYAVGILLGWLVEHLVLYRWPAEAAEKD